jgi:lysophospholipase
LERAVDPKKTYRPRNDPDSKEQPQDFSSDRQRMRLHDAWLEANPDWQTRSLTFGWVRAVCRAIDLLTDPDSPGIKAKALILTAGRDILVDNRKIDSIKIKASDLTHLHLPDAKHEIFMERDSLRAPALAAIQAFIRTGTPKP